MRRGMQGGIRRTEDGLIESVNLGADFTSEHEWGIKELERGFGLDKTASPGVPRRTIHIVPSRGLFIDKKLNAVAYVGKWDEETKLYPHAASEVALFHDDDVVVGAWSDGDFAARFPDDEQGRKDAQEILDAFHRKDMAFLFANVGDNPFARSGLNLVIVSRLPQEIVDDLAVKDADHDALVAAATATGIKARIDAASKRGTRDYMPSFGYYALSPRWANDEKTEVKFWLNPTDQQHNNAGYFTVEQLDQWLEGKGPIPGKRER